MTNFANFVNENHKIIIIYFYNIKLIFLERFCGTRETYGSATSTAPVRRDQTAASPGQHQQQHDRYHIVH